LQIITCGESTIGIAERNRDFRKGNFPQRNSPTLLAVPQKIYTVTGKNYPPNPFIFIEIL
jgi:hypothetical protein